MATQETEGLPGITLWHISRSLGRLESHAEQNDARMDRADVLLGRIEARLDRVEGQLDRLFLAVLRIGTTLIGGPVTVLVKLFAG